MAAIQVDESYPRPRYDADLRSTLAYLCPIKELTSREIADHCHISLRMVERCRSNLLHFGEIYPSAIKPKGRQSKITVAVIERLQEWILEQEQSPTLDEMQEMLDTEFDIEVHTSNIWRRLKKEGLSWKRGERRHPQRNEDSCDLWLAKAMNWKASQLVVVDESSTNERALDRRWGWSPKGTAYRMTQSVARRSKSWSILPAIGINGYLYYEIYQGSFDSERFLHFIESVLKFMNPYPGPRSVLIMDNCRTHHAPELQEMCDAKGVLLEYLPAYSPHLSPIEESFSVLKAWVRSHREFGKYWAAQDEFGMFLHTAVRRANLGERARGLFRSCGYVVEDEDVDIDYRELIERDELE
jgi:transposase